MSMSLGSVQQLTASLSNLGSQLADAAPSGAFGAVLAQVNAEREAGADGGQPPQTTASTKPLKAAKTSRKGKAPA